MKTMVKFARTGSLCYISHLDLMRCVQRTFRRADLPLAYSQGFNPHPILSFAQALSVGMETHGDYLEVGFTEPVEPKHVIEALNTHAPAGFKALAARTMEEGEKSPMARIVAAQYAIRPAEADIQAFAWGIEKMLQQTTYIYEKRTKSGMKQQDMRPLIHSIVIEGAQVHAIVSCGNENLAPQALVQAVCQLGAMESDGVSWLREDLFVRDEQGTLVPLIV